MEAARRVEERLGDAQQLEVRERGDGRSARRVVEQRALTEVVELPELHDLAHLRAVLDRDRGLALHDDVELLARVPLRDDLGALGTVHLRRRRGDMGEIWRDMARLGRRTSLSASCSRCSCEIVSDLSTWGDAGEMWGRYGGGVGEMEAVGDVSTSTPRSVLVSCCAEVCRVTSWKTVRCRRHSLPAAEHTTVAARGLE